MSLETVNTLATLGTFVVIAVTATAAIAQLRHARSSNQIGAMNEIRERLESHEFQRASQFVGTQLSATLRDATFRFQLLNRKARTDENAQLIAQITLLGNFFESMGIYVRTGLVERNLAMEIWSEIVTDMWNELAPVTAISRRSMGSVAWENFEYLAVLSEDWVAAHPKGTYPPEMRRITLKDEWADADRTYSTSLATA